MLLILVLIALLVGVLNLLVAHHFDRFNNRRWLVRLATVAAAAILLFVFIYIFIIMWSSVINGFMAAANCR